MIRLYIILTVFLFSGLLNTDEPKIEYDPKLEYEESCVSIDLIKTKVGEVTNINPADPNKEFDDLVYKISKTEMGDRRYLHDSQKKLKKFQKFHGRSFSSILKDAGKSGELSDDAFELLEDEFCKGGLTWEAIKEYLRAETCVETRICKIEKADGVLIAAGRTTNINYPYTGIYGGYDCGLDNEGVTCSIGYREARRQMTRVLVRLTGNPDNPDENCLTIGSETDTKIIDGKETEVEVKRIKSCDAVISFLDGDYVTHMLPNASTGYTEGRNPEEIRVPKEGIKSKHFVKSIRKMKIKFFSVGNKLFTPPNRYGGDFNSNKDNFETSVKLVRVVPIILDQPIMDEAEYSLEVYKHRTIKIAKRELIIKKIPLIPYPKIPSAKKAKQPPKKSRYTKWIKFVEIPIIPTFPTTGKKRVIKRDDRYLGTLVPHEMLIIKKPNESVQEVYKVAGGSICTKIIRLKKEKEEE